MRMDVMCAHQLRPPPNWMRVLDFVGVDRHSQVAPAEPPRPLALLAPLDYPPISLAR